MRRGSMTIVVALLTCATSFITLGCNLFQKNQPPTFSNDIGWATSNMDLSFGGKRGEVQPATAFRLFQVFIDDHDDRNDIVEIDVIDPDDRTWYIEDHYNDEGGVLGRLVLLRRQHTQHSGTRDL